MPNRDSGLDEALRASADTADDDLKVRLLAEFHHGRALSTLLPLLRSKNDNAARTGAWIASELGKVGKELLPDIRPLLGHHDPIVRFFVLDCILNWASIEAGPTLADAVELIYDVSSAVRWKALRFIASASVGQLDAARSSLGPASIEAGHLEWLISPDARDPVGVSRRLRASDAVTRKYALVAAARLSPVTNEPLIEASRVADPEARQFASDTLSLSVHRA